MLTFLTIGWTLNLAVLVYLKITSKNQPPFDAGEMVLVWLLACLPYAITCLAILALVNG
jgi:hypothetical protein